MTNPIERAAINAAAHWLFADDAPCVEGCACDMSRPEAESILEAAMPHIRKQIAEEIRYGINEYSGQLIEQAARIAEGDPK